MTRHTHKTSVSHLMGAPVRGPQGAPLGSLQEFAVSPEAGTDRVATLVLRPKGAGGKSGLVGVDVGQLRLDDAFGIHLQPGAEPVPFRQGSDVLLLERDLLDQQIIDVNGHKVVRVNDVGLVWEPAGEADNAVTLRIHDVEIGLRGAVRRLLKGLPAASIERLACRFRSTVIPWNFVDLIDRDPSRRVRLKVEGDHLSRMHPSDLADILEELAPTERSALFNSLNEEVAAETLEEVNAKTKQALIETLDSETVAGIVEEMDPGAAADLLAELPDERSEAILEEMDPEERREVEDLLEFAGDSAAGQMTTDYLSIPKDATVSDVKASLRDFDGDVELVIDVYLTNDRGQTCGILPLVHILLADESRKLEELPHGHFVSCDPDTSGKRVAELFDKYNLRSLPVIDSELRLVGVVHAEQVIASLRAKR